MSGMMMELGGSGKPRKWTTISSRLSHLRKSELRSLRRIEVRRNMNGFIVVNPLNGALGLAEANVLWVDDSVTLFQTRQAARNAIRRTLRYAARKGYTGYPAWSGCYTRPAKWEA